MTCEAFCKKLGMFQELPEHASCPSCYSPWASHHDHRQRSPASVVVRCPAVLARMIKDKWCVLLFLLFMCNK